MAKLNAKQRKAIPKSQFGVPSKAPGSGSYPLNDKAHAQAALRLIGHASPADQKKIRAKANKVLGKSSKKK